MVEGMEVLVRSGHMLPIMCLELGQCNKGKIYPPHPTPPPTLSNYLDIHCPYKI